MILRITSKRQVTPPAHVLDALGVGPCDRLKLIPTPDGFLLRLRRIDYSRLGTLKGKILENQQPFDIRTFREKLFDSAIRD